MDTRQAVTLGVRERWLRSNPTAAREAESFVLTFQTLDVLLNWMSGGGGITDDGANTLRSRRADKRDVVTVG